jgi:hypothetical protein
MLVPNLFFSGIMFPVKCRDLLPLHHLVINSVAVRGQLGPMTVWIYNRKKMLKPADNVPNSNAYDVSMHPRDWIKIYEQRHKPSPREYQKLVLQSPVLLTPGQVIVLYIHSTLQGDEAIVYDNVREGPQQSRRFLQQFRNAPPQRRRTPVADRCLEILPARAHVSNVPFGSRPIWGWGFAWRDDREFVGRLEYGCVYRLWNPTCHVRFASNFNTAVQTLLLCQRRYESVWSMLPDDCIYYILNMCRWDWFNDGVEDYQQHRRRRLSRRPMSTTSVQQMIEEAPADNSPAVIGVCTTPCNRLRTSSTEVMTMVTEQQHQHGVDVDEDVDDDDDDDDDYVDEEEEDNDDEEEQDDDDNSEGLRVNGNFFRINASSDDDGDDESQVQGRNNVIVGGHDDHDEDDDETSRAWIRRQFARLHVLRALAAMEENADVEMHT